MRPLGDAAWVAAALARHAGLVRRVRARFERLRPRPVRLAGSRTARRSTSRRRSPASQTSAPAPRWTIGCMSSVGAARRELAVALLVDVSASTDGWVSSNRRIVDVEKEALLVVCEALDALGDRLLAYSRSRARAPRTCPCCR